MKPFERARMSNPAWTELQRWARRIVRFDPAYGRCPDCGFGATRLESFCGMRWCVCDLCVTRWPSLIQGLRAADFYAGEEVFDEPEPADDLAFEEPTEEERREIEEFQFQRVLALARCRHVAPLVSSSPTVDMAALALTPGADPLAAFVNLPQHVIQLRGTEPMKTTRRTIQIDLPATVASLTAGLDPQTVCPQLAEAEEELVDARRRLVSARSDVEARRARVEQLSAEAASGTGGAAYEREYAALMAATNLLPRFEERVVGLERSLTETREAARIATLAEARRRQEVLNEAGRPLLLELQKLDELERAFRDRVAQIPSAPGAGISYMGSFRDQELLSQ
jgi:hypothetical protein